MPPFQPGNGGGPGRPPGPRILNVESAQALLRSAKKIGDLIARERGDDAAGLEAYWDELYRVDPVRHYTLTAQNHPRETAMAVGMQVQDVTPRAPPAPLDDGGLPPGAGGWRAAALDARRRGLDRACAA